MSLAKQIIADALDMDEDELHDDFPIRSGFDKKILQDFLEEEYGIMITSENMADANTVQEMADLIDHHLPY